MASIKQLFGTLLFAWLACAGCGGPEVDSDVGPEEGLEEGLADFEVETHAAAQVTFEIELQPTKMCELRDASTDPNAIRCRLPGMRWWRCQQGSTVTYSCLWWFQEP